MITSRRQRSRSLGRRNGFTGNGDVTLTFAHNPARQIVSRSVPASASFYAYSPANGDTTYGVDGLNRLTTAGPASLGYDGRGNLTAVGSATYAYDAANRLVATGDGASLTYDPIDRLYRTARSGFQTTKFLYDGPNLIAEYDDAGTTVLRRYVHGPGIDEPLVWYEGPTVNDKRWHQADNQGSILAMSQGLGGTLGTYRYDAYGQLFVDPGQISRFQYTGQTAVPEAGLLNYKARMYSPALGRFMQTDPIGGEDDPNLYAYVRGDPIDNTDPAGTVCQPCLGAAFQRAGGRLVFAGIASQVDSPVPGPGDVVGAVAAVGTVALLGELSGLRTTPLDVGFDGQAGATGWAVYSSGSLFGGPPTAPRPCMA